MFYTFVKNIKNMSVGKKTLFFFIYFLILLSIISIISIDIQWCYSLIIGCISYIILIVYSVLSISKKISTKIKQAQKLTNNETTESNEKNDKKKILKYIDLSKISLGLELSFSIQRLFAFFIMIFGLFILIFSNTFYPLAYIAGVIIGSIFVISYFLIVYNP